MIKYACLNAIAPVGLAHLPEGFVKTEKVEEAEAIIVRSAKMHDMERSSKLLAIARAGAGVNNIPIEDCAKEGIVVFNTPGANANGVKELVIAALLLASRDIIGGVNWVSSEKENPDIAALVEKTKKNFAGCEISGKKLGIIGLGAIGQLVANAATHLGMEVLGYDPYISIDAAWNLSRSVQHIKDVNQIYAECDYITIHVPAVPATIGMINENAISRMKKNVAILNFARDILVDEKALVKALNEGRVRTYVTDFANPVIKDGKNVIITPHIGASTKESEDNCAEMAAREIREYLLKGNIKNSVNYPACDLGDCTAASRVAIHHKNVVNMISQLSGVISKCGINISNFTDKSKGDYAYSLLDLESEATEELLEELRKVEGVIRVRKVK